VFNCTGVILTTNYKTDGIHLPPDDRRHYVAWSPRVIDDFEDGYWNQLYDWYAAGGDHHVAAYLAELDISDWDPKAPPPKTQAFWEIVNAGRAPEDAELADVIDQLGKPEERPVPAFTLSDVKAANGMGDLDTWLNDRKNMRAVPHRLEKVGYVPLRNDDAKDGLWLVQLKGGTREKPLTRRAVIYVRKGLSYHEQLAAAHQRRDRDGPSAS
jgi:hypothetical protein